MSDIIEPPWTPEQIAGLDKYQREGYFHPYTCPNRGDGAHRNRGLDLGTLVPTPNGWVCLDCPYQQKWAHAFSVMP